MAQLYICTQTFMSNHRDREVWVTPGQIAEAGSWVLAVSPDSFKALTIDYLAPGSKLADNKPAQQHPQRLADAEDPAGTGPPATAPDGGFIARTDGKVTGTNDDGTKPPATAPDGGFAAHGEVHPEAEAKHAEPRAPRRSTHKSARKAS